MFDRILALFSKTPATPSHLPTAQADIAVGALLVRAAKVDGVYLYQEAEQIDEVLARRYALSPAQARAMRETCEVLEEQMPSALELVSLMRNHIPATERSAIVAALWSVVFADRIEHHDEEGLLRTIEDVLGVSRAQSLVLREQEFDRAYPLWARPAQKPTPPA